MPWKKIGKIAAAVFVGGGIASGQPAEAIEIPPELVQSMSALFGALTTLIMLFVRSPKDE